MYAEEALPPSPFLSTYLGLQGPDAFDAVVFEPPGTPQCGIVFLHGFAGNFSVLDAFVARAAREAGAVTICPSAGWMGAWAKEERTVRACIDHLRARGIRRIFLAGLSNGALGASALAPRLSRELSGLILLSGSDLSEPDSGLPVLLVIARNDERMYASMAREYAERAGKRGTLVELTGDHFVLAKDPEAVRRAVSSWEPLRGP